MPTNFASPIMIVEDSDEDYEALIWALRKVDPTYTTRRCADGDEALEYLFRRGRYAPPTAAPRPAIVLLDLNLTSINGVEVLQQIKQDDNLRLIPVIVWTNSANPNDVARSYRSGANSYMLKRLDLDAFVREVEALTRYWFDVVMLPGNTPG
jgi:CheY-like chemotaxis protein